MNQPEPSAAERAALDEFLKQLLEDQRLGLVGPVEQYLQAWPDHEAAIARLYDAYMRPEQDPEEVTFSRGRPRRTTSKESGWIEHYKIVKLLGRGGQGSVYLAEDTHLRRKVAIKLLEIRAEPGSTTMRRYRREAEIASKLDHPGICAVHDSGFEVEEPYIVMQHVEGRSLAEHIRAAKDAEEGSCNTIFESLYTGDFEPEPITQTEGGSSTISTTSVNRRKVMEAARIIEDTARALHEAHEAHVVHRDIKPGNIMVAHDGHPVILDFGLARDEEGMDSDLTQPGDFFGTIAYMSPEQLLHQRVEVDRRSDIYSLGVTLYELVTLIRPFSAPTSEATILAIQGGDARPARELNHSIPPDLDIVIQTAMEKDRARRYQSALDFAEDLRRVRELEPIQARPVSPLVKLSRWAQRKPALATALALLFLFLTVGLVGALSFASRLDVANTQYGLLANSRTLDELLAEKIWPAVPDKVPEFDAWINRARNLAGTLDEHRAALAELREEEGTLERDEDGAEHWTFPENRQQWRHDMLEKLVKRLDAFANGPMIAALEARRTFAAELRKKSIDDHREIWDKAIRSIATDGRFQAYHLEEQLGLVPLGPDPDTNLWEFACLGTGEVPERDSKTGRFEVTGDTAVVFVLVPGGGFKMGTQGKDPDGPNYDPWSLENEHPVIDVGLGPFMISKFELTQGQCLRMEGINPSGWAAGTTRTLASKSKRLVVKISYAHPVESISWHDCQVILGKYRMVLPTEAQWEYAARAGTSTPFYCGSSVSSLAGHANLADGGSAEFFGPNHKSDRELDDGFVIPAPVGSFKPNPFGLYDVHGNVSEWVREKQGDYGQPMRPGDGLHEGKKLDIGLARGGSYAVRAALARCGMRIRAGWVVKIDRLGVRPGWPLRRP